MELEEQMPPHLQASWVSLLCLQPFYMPPGPGVMLMSKMLWCCNPKVKW